MGVKNPSRQTGKNTYRNSYAPPVNKTGKKASRGNRKIPAASVPAKRKRTITLPHPSFSTVAKWLGALLRLLLLLCLIGVLLSGIAWGVFKAYTFCTTNSYFNITSINVTGNDRITSREILDKCGLETGMNSLSVNLHDMEKLLLKNPWIESVSIKRNLPDSIDIAIKERTPAFVAKKKDTLYYINPAGKIIAPVESSNFLSLPILEIGPGGEESLPLVSDFMEQFRKAGFPFQLSQISWFRISAGSGFELYWESRQLRLSIGLENWKDNIKRLSSVIADIEQRKETGKVTGIRSADGQVWMTKEDE